MEEVEGYGFSDGISPSKWNGIIGALVDKVLILIPNHIKIVAGFESVGLLCYLESRRWDGGHRCDGRATESR